MCNLVCILLLLFWTKPFRYFSPFDTFILSFLSVLLSEMPFLTDFVIFFFFLTKWLLFMSCTFTVFSLIRNPDNYFIHKKKLLPYELRKVTAFYHCSKKVQSQRFALQELLKQFLLMYLYCTSSFLFQKKIQPIFYYFSFSDTSASLVFPL